MQKFSFPAMCAIVLACTGIGAAAAGFAQVGAQQAQNQKTAAAADEFKGDPYPFDTCAVRGVKLPGKAVVRVHEGRQVKFCCNNCAGKFDADPQAVLAEVNKKVVASQMPYYPWTDCPIGKHSLDEGDSPIEAVVYNRLVRLCCEHCLESLNEDPMKTIKQLDEAIIAKQSADYPLETCPVSGEELGSHGEPANVVIAGRLVKLCCAPCTEDVMNNPAPVLAELDKAWQQAKPEMFRTKR